MDVRRILNLFVNPSSDGVNSVGFLLFGASGGLSPAVRLGAAPTPTAVYLLNPLYRWSGSTV
ncbi:hypothetical protein [Caldilinea sp.]|uniref:hypothetical protein n=1 Tax=Caldilinea sp. TaxID=2293560 RepID=UPI002610FF41|nr:hypothetical protein [Caldilinea sp.]